MRSKCRSAVMPATQPSRRQQARSRSWLRPALLQFAVWAFLLATSGPVGATHPPVLESESGILEKPIWTCITPISNVFSVNVTANQCATLWETDLNTNTTRRCAIRSVGIFFVTSTPNIYTNHDGEEFPARFFQARAFMLFDCQFPRQSPFIFGGEARTFFFVLDSNLTIRLAPLSEPQESGQILTSVEPGKSSKAMVAKVFDQNGQVVPNVNIKLEVNVEPNSGGHDADHDPNRPKGELSSSSGQVSEENTVLTGNTGADGLPFTFKAPAPAGDHTITGSCIGRTCMPDGPNMIEVEVEGLIPIPLSQAYELIGSRPRHRNNHFLTTGALFRIAALAALYKATFPDPDDPVLHLNDASLIQGGLFDLNGNWNPPHHEHRRGTVIDIRANLEEGAIPEDNFSKFEELARAHGMNAKREVEIDDATEQEIISTRHYHVRIFGRKE